MYCNGFIIFLGDELHKPRAFVQALHVMFCMLHELYRLANKYCLKQNVNFYKKISLLCRWVHMGIFSFFFFFFFFVVVVFCFFFGSQTSVLFLISEEWYVLECHKILAIKGSGPRMAIQTIK